MAYLDFLSYLIIIGIPIAIIIAIKASKKMHDQNGSDYLICIMLAIFFIGVVLILISQDIESGSSKLPGIGILLISISVLFFIYVFTKSN